MDFSLFSSECSLIFSLSHSHSLSVNAPLPCCTAPFSWRPRRRLLFSACVRAASSQTVLQLNNKTRMHSSKMRTARSLTVSRSICRGHAWHACLPAMHAPRHACPPLPHMPPAMHAPPAIHAPSMHTPLSHMPPSPCGLTDTCKNLTFANFVWGQ